MHVRVGFFGGRDLVLGDGEHEAHLQDALVERDGLLGVPAPVGDVVDALELDGHGGSLLCALGEHAPVELVALDGLEESLEVAFAEALVALALDDLEEERFDHGLGEDLEQQLRLSISTVPSRRMPRAFMPSVSWPCPGRRSATFRSRCRVVAT